MNACLHSCVNYPAFKSYLFCTALYCHLALWILLNMGFHGEVLLAPRPTPKLEDHPLSAVRDCLFNLFAAPCRRPFLHPQPEDAPCRGDRDPLITWALVSTVMNFGVSKMRGISWLAAEPVSFLRRTLLHGVSKYYIVTCGLSDPTKYSHIISYMVRFSEETSCPKHFAFSEDRSEIQ